MRANAIWVMVHTVLVLTRVEYSSRLKGYRNGSPWHWNKSDMSVRGRIPLKMSVALVLKLPEELKLT